MTAPTFTQFCQGVGLQLTLGQECIARVAIDGESITDLPDQLALIEREIFGAVEWPLPPSAKGVVGLVLGARSGKSLIFESAYSLWRALFADLDMLGPGEIATALIVAPDLRLAQIDVRFVDGLLRRVPQLARFVSRTTQTAITVTRPDRGCVSIEAIPGSEAGRSLRGRSLVSAVLAEAAFFRDDESAVSDIDIFNAVAPRVIRGGLVIVSSTPWVETGLLFDLYDKNWSHPRTALVAHASTTQMRDDEHTAAIVARETERDPENARREFGAEFGSRDASLLASADIDACVDLDRTETPAVRGSRYCAAIDAASRNDLFVFMAAHRELQKRPQLPPTDVVVVDAARYWAPSFIGRLTSKKVDLDVVEVELAALAKHYRCSLWADLWSFDALEHLLSKRGVVMRDQPMHGQAQQQRASKMVTLFRQRRIRLPNNKELVKHLKALRILRSAGGQVKFAAPERKGVHDDFGKCTMLIVEQAVKLQPCGGDIVCVSDPLFWTDGKLSGGTKNYFVREANGDLTQSPPPLGTTDYARAQRARLEKGVFTPQDLDELGETELATRIANHGFSQEELDGAAPHETELLRRPDMPFPISPEEEMLEIRMGRLGPNRNVQ